MSDLAVGAEPRPPVASRRRGSRLARVSLLLGVLLIGGFAIVWHLGSILVRPVASAPAKAGPPARDLWIGTDDGVRLAATYRPGAAASSPGVLLLHGNGGSRSSVEELARWLSSLGYATLAIDFRGHGRSTQRPHSFGLNEAHDAAAAFAWLKREQHGGRIGVIGISLGGAAALLGDKGPLAADALVLQAVYPDIRHAIRNRVAAQLSRVAAAAIEPLLSYQAWPRFGVGPSRLSPIDALGRYHGPVLVIGGARDRYTPPSETRALFAAAQGPKRLWLAPGLDHAALSDIGSADYRSLVADFLARNLRPRAPTRARPAL